MRGLTETVHRYTSIGISLRNQMCCIRDAVARPDDTAVSPTAAALAKVATDAVHLLAGPDAPQLRACHAPGCVLYFIKTHPRREWCSDGCGNRVRAARHYQRTRKS